jgi:hypothetical protein
MSHYRTIEPELPEDDPPFQTLIDSRPEDWLRSEDEKVFTLKRDLNVTVRERCRSVLGHLINGGRCSAITGRLIFQNGSDSEHVF